MHTNAICVFTLYCLSTQMMCTLIQ